LKTFRFNLPSQQRETRKLNAGEMFVSTLIQVEQLEVTLSREQERAGRAQESLATTRTNLTQVR
jgi:hypothetical protein